MIRLSNGHCFEYMTASGALRWDGKGWPWEQPLRWIRLPRERQWIRLLDPSLFTSVAKTFTIRPRKGNPWWKSVRWIPGGVANAVKLANPGIDWWCKKIGPSVNSTKIPLVASIFGEPKESAEMARMLNGFDLVGLEINASCPNIKIQDTAKVIANCEAVKANSRLPLILKVSVVHDVSRIVKEVENIIEAISINSIPWAIAFPNRRSPLELLGGGGVSGKAAQPFTWGLVQKLTKLTAIPVIGPSIWGFSDLEKVRSLGAKAISFGSIHLRLPFGPALPTWYVRKERKLKQLRV